MQKKNIYSDCVIEEGVAEEIALPEEEIALNSSTVTLKWNVKANILKKTGSFYKKAGSKIYTNIQVNCSKKIRIGIIKDGKTKQYYETKTGGVKTFNITTAGQYNIFVQNVTNNTIKAEGYYIK